MNPQVALILVLASVVAGCAANTLNGATTGSTQSTVAKAAPAVAAVKSEPAVKGAGGVTTRTVIGPPRVVGQKVESKVVQCETEAAAKICIDTGNCPASTCKPVVAKAQ